MMAWHSETIALTFRMLLYVIHCRPMHVYFLVPPPFAMSLRCYFASMRTCKESLDTWPADWTVSLDLTVSHRRYNGFISSF